MDDCEMNLPADDRYDALSERLRLACANCSCSAWWQHLTPPQQQALVAQIEAIDFKLLKQQLGTKTAIVTANTGAPVAKSPPAIIAGATNNRFSANAAASAVSKPCVRDKSA